MAEDVSEEAPSTPVWRVVLGAVAVLALLAGIMVVVGGSGSSPPRNRRAEARAIADAWLQAWGDRNRRAMRHLVATPPPSFAAVVDAATVDGGRLTAVAGVPTVGRDAALVPFEAAVELPGFGTWRYEGAIPLVEVDVPVDNGDETERLWRVDFRPAVLHPDLTEARRFVFERAWSPRGGILARNGSPLPLSLRSFVGTVGALTADEARELGDVYRAGDVAGRTGMQAGLESLLAGRPSGEVRLLEGDRVVSVAASFAGAAGQTVRTTFDPRLVETAQAVLGAEGNAAALVAIQPSTGALRAVAYRPANGFPRALLGRYPPGSTFKVITTVALLAAGVTPETRVSCPKEITVNGRTISNAEDEELGDISFRDAFAHSCNTAFIQLAQRLQPADLVAAAERLGFNRELDLGIPAAASTVPMPAGEIDLVSSAIGQGRILVTPLQMASVAATVAAGGYRPPTIVELPSPPPLEVLPPDQAATLQELMRLVVTEGTGQRARLPGTPVAGKTGTAEFGTAVPPRTHGWFIAFRGDLAVAVIVEDGGFGGEVAAPLAAEFFRRVGG